MAVVACQCLELLCAVLVRFSLGLFALQKLLVRQGLTLAVESKFNQLASQFLILQVEQIC
jgi:hypothetical protein